MYFFNIICNNCGKKKTYLDYSKFYRNEKGEMVSYPCGGHSFSEHYAARENGFDFKKYSDNDKEKMKKDMYNFLEEREISIFKMLVYNTNNNQFEYMSEKEIKKNEDNIIQQFKFWRKTYDWHPDYEDGYRLFICKECEEKSVTCHMGGCI